MTNPFYKNVMLEYLQEKNNQLPYFISITRDNKLILKSGDEIYNYVKDTAYFMANSDLLR